MTNKSSKFLHHEQHHEGNPHDDMNQSNIGHHHHDDHNHDHHHHSFRDKNAKVLLLCLAVTFIFAIVEGLGGYFTHSIALLSDALHMLTDAAGLLIAYVANNISKKPATINLTFGYGKAEAVGALVNCTFTIVLTLALLIEVLHRLFEPVEVHGSGLFIIATCGFIINGLVAFILMQGENSLNTKAALLHALGDLFASLVAIVAGAIIYYTHLSIVDPILSLIVIFILIVSNYRLIKQSTIVLMAGVPDYINYEEVGRDLKKVEGVLDVHDLHIWYMSANIPALSAHIIAKTPYNWNDILKACQEMLSNKYEISHITIQQEFDPCPDMHYCEIR